MTHHDQRTLGEIAAALSLVWAGTALADQPSPPGRQRTSSELDRYEETPAAVAPAGTREVVAQIGQAGSGIEWSLTYRRPTDVTQSHPRSGHPATTAGIVLVLCTNLTPPGGPGC